MAETKRAAALLCALMLLLSGCGGGTREPPASAYQLQRAMLAADTTLPEMLVANSSDADAEESFGYLSTLEYSKVAGYFLAYSANGMADEIAVIVLRDARDAPDAAATLKKHVQGRVELYRNYEPAQVARAEDAVVFTHDLYAVLIISDDPEASRAAFLSAVSGQ